MIFDEHALTSCHILREISAIGVDVSPPVLSRDIGSELLQESLCSNWPSTVDVLAFLLRQLIRFSAPDAPKKLLLKFTIGLRGPVSVPTVELFIA